MRAKEFLIEVDSLVHSKIKPHPDHEAVMPSAHRVAGTADRTYDLNRIMMAVAELDGIKILKPKTKKQSWPGKNNIATPYTTVERNMLKHAYKALGADWDDVLAPNEKQQSLEPKDTYTVSPVPKFKNPFKR